MPDENSSKQTASVKLADISKQTPVENNAKQAPVETSGKQSGAIKLANIAQPVAGENIAIENRYYRTWLPDIRYPAAKTNQ